MIIFLVIVLIALTFGFVFAKLDSLNKTCRIIREDNARLQEELSKIKERINK